MSQIPDEITTLVCRMIVQRQDGVGFACTSSDRSQVIGDIRFHPTMDFKLEELKLVDQMYDSVLEVSAGMKSEALVMDELVSGGWDGASVELFAGDWAAADSTSCLGKGRMTKTRIDDGRLKMSIDVLPSAALSPPCIQTSPECRAVLGDSLCRVDMRGRRFRIKITAVQGDELAVDADDVERFAMGRLRWISGNRCGEEQLIIAAHGDRVVLENALSSTPSIGDKAILSEGCDGRRATCTDRFSNILNFRGEPDLPGSEVLLRFPGA